MAVANWGFVAACWGVVPIFYERLSNYLFPPLSPPHTRSFDEAMHKSEAKRREVLRYAVQMLAGLVHLIVPHLGFVLDATATKATTGIGAIMVIVANVEHWSCLGEGGRLGVLGASVVALYAAFHLFLRG